MDISWSTRVIGWHRSKNSVFTSSVAFENDVDFLEAAQTLSKSWG